MKTEEDDKRGVQDGEVTSLNFGVSKRAPTYPNIEGEESMGIVVWEKGILGR